MAPVKSIGMRSSAAFALGSSMPGYQQPKPAVPAATTGTVKNSYYDTISNSNSNQTNAVIKNDVPSVGQQKVLSTAENTAIAGRNLKTANMASAATQALLADPSQGFDTSKWAKSTTDAYRMSAANSLENNRQMFAPVANSGSAANQFAQLALQNSADTAKFAGDTSMQAANKKQDDLKNAIATGISTNNMEATNQNDYLSGLSTARNMGEGDANRKSAEMQTGMTLENQRDIARISNDTERWKTDKAAELTKLGYSADAAKAAADRESQLTIAKMNNSLQRDVEAGKLSMQEKELAQQANQFTNQQEYSKWALLKGFDENSTQRAWQANQTAMDQAWKSSEGSLDRQMQDKIAQGQLDVETAKLAQSAAQFNDSLAWQKEAAKQGIDATTAQRAWQESQNALDRSMTKRGFDMNAVQYLINSKMISPTDAFNLQKKMADDAGVNTSGWVMQTTPNETITTDQTSHDLAAQQAQYKSQGLNGDGTYKWNDAKSYLGSNGSSTLGDGKIQGSDVVEYINPLKSDAGSIANGNVNAGSVVSAVINPGKVVTTGVDNLGKFLGLWG